jgi:permease, DMT superfamily
MPKIGQKTKGIIYIVVAAFGFSFMSLFVKLAGDLPAFQKAFFRNFIALIFITVMMLRENIGFAPKKENIPGILGRSLCGTLGLLCNFYALGTLNLSDANMLNKLSPFFAIIFSIFLLREKPTAAQVLGVAVAFGGSLLIIKPGFADAQLIPALAGVLGGLGAGAAYTFVRKLGKKGENSKRIVFYFSAFSCLFCLPFLIVQYKSMTFLQTLYLIFAGTFACVGQLGITKAYLCAPAKEISVYDYTQVIFAALLGFFVFGDLPDIWSVLGYILICGAGVAMFFYNKRKEG